MLRKTPTSPSLLTTTRKTLIGAPGPYLIIATPLPLSPDAHPRSHFNSFDLCVLISFVTTHFISTFLLTLLIILMKDPTIIHLSFIIIVHSCAISLSMVLLLWKFITTHSCLKHVLYCSLIYVHTLASLSTLFSSYFLFLH